MKYFAIAQAIATVKAASRTRYNVSDVHIEIVL